MEAIVMFIGVILLIAGYIIGYNVGNNDRKVRPSSTPKHTHVWSPISVKKVKIWHSRYEGFKDNKKDNNYHTHPHVTYSCLSCPEFKEEDITTVVWSQLVEDKIMERTMEF